MLDLLAAMLWPPACLGCAGDAPVAGSDGDPGGLGAGARAVARALCPACLSALPRDDGPRCARCDAACAAGPGGSRRPRLCGRCRQGVGLGAAGCAGAVRRVYGYRGPIVALVHAGKHRGAEHAWPAAAALIARDAEACALLAAATLVPVPLAPARRRTRGYSQAAALARALGALVQRPVAHLLRCVRTGPPQSLQRGAGRADAMQGAFAPCAPLPGHGAVPLVLVDDVATTGATLAAAAAALRAAGAADVRAVTLACAGRPPGSG